MEQRQTLEQMLEQIDALVKTMESGAIPLSEHLALFERGVGLIRNCEQALREAEGRVRILTDGQALADGTGTPDQVLADFSPEPRG